MATEIERKFLLLNDSWRRDADAGISMRQGYLVGAKRASVRVRVSGERAHLNIKSATLGVERQEYEYGIPLADAEELLDTLCERPLIEKTRYHVRHGKHTWEIDVFSGDNAGLVVAEIELDSADENFARPDWLGEEVSHDKRYYNVCLVTHPYKDW
ncbi:MAG: CYTH domain-containing protein [Gammaproteobacteria bacterium]|nr:CYTH domain-containing protein [Gammaproteobacteria bacterium]MCF6362983.1 CYTH domain-containing protein [Gammaproteobacteria bacterium]